MPQKSQKFYSLLIILQCAIFGFSFIAIKLLLDAKMPPFLLIAIRFVIGTMLLFAVGKGINFSKENKFSKREVLFGLIAGGIMFSGYALQTVGALSTTPAKNGLFTGLFVVFVPLIVMISTRRFKAKPLLLALLALFGVAVTLNVFSSENLSFAIGDLLSVLCGLSFAFHYVCLEKASRNSESLNPFNFTTVQLAIVAIVALLLSLCFEVNQYSAIEWSKVAFPLLFLGIAATAIAYILQFFAQKKISAERTALLSCSESVFTLLISLIYGFDKFSWLFILGMAIILTALILSSIEKKSTSQ